MRCRRGCKRIISALSAAALCLCAAAAGYLPEAPRVTAAGGTISSGSIWLTDASGTAADKKLIEVSALSQYPELPTGCEVVSLTMVLNYLGYNIDKLTLAREYLPRLDFYLSKGELYGADFRTTFAGDPESVHAYGCYAPCITTTANRYLATADPGCVAVDITGTSFDRLITDYIDRDTPVLIWITSDDLHETEPTGKWLTPEGEEMQWLAYEHCVVLTGYDKENGLIYVTDPQKGRVSYRYDRISQRYADMGRQAVFICSGEQWELMKGRYTGGFVKFFWQNFKKLLKS